MESKIREDIEENNLSDMEGYTHLPHEVEEKLEWFQNKKLGVIFHWGLYAEAGIVESWQLSKEDEWARKEAWRKDIHTLRKDYWNLNHEFNPIKFNPEEWAEKCKVAGFKYAIFTTKHHDGFNMYDTKYSDYKITGEDCPFHTNKHADIYGEVVKAFKKQNFGIGAYFSKPDWHSQYYWKNVDEAAGRYASYDTDKNQKTWNQFVSYTHNQLREICNNYGKIDILWLDGGWVQKENKEDIKLDKIVPELRQHTPDLLVVDRAVGGEFENYVTPERKVPAEIPKKVWESNIPLANNWGYVPNDTYKSFDELSKNIIEIVGKGGNVILGIGPKPDGTLPKEALVIMEKLSGFTQKYGEAIYDTRAIFVNTMKNWYFTKSIKSNKKFAFCVEDKNSEIGLDWLKNSLFDVKLKNIDSKFIYTSNDKYKQNAMISVFEIIEGAE